MPVFRPELATYDNRPITAPVVRKLCAALTHSANFFVAEPLRLAWAHESREDVFWELFNGQALDASRTRQRHAFEAWNVNVIAPSRAPSGAPLLSVKYDATAGRVYVTRAVLCHAYESYDAGGNVIQTRPALKWQRELVGTVSLSEFTSAGPLRDELASLLFHAVVGASRLPLTSVEAPLPAFTLGQLGYVHRPVAVEADETAMCTVEELVLAAPTLKLGREEFVKLWELAIRSSSTTDLEAIALGLDQLAHDGGWDIQALFLEMFNAVSLSPYTDFVSKALVVLRLWAGLDPWPRLKVRAEVVALVIALIARHLTAYDLVTFHHCGANYPDALLVGELLGELVPLAEQHAALFASNPALRRALRDGLLVVSEYAGHAVPDVPTSPGENLRVLPQPFDRVPDDQIYSPITRQRRLFPDGLPRINGVARDCFRDLDDTAELRQLGTALYLDRPLGFAKAPGEQDQTLLASHVLFSRTIGKARLLRLARLQELVPVPGAVERWLERLRSLPVDGVALKTPGAPARPGVVSLHDALRLADDWIILSTTRKTLNDFAGQYDLRPLVDRFGPALPPFEDWRLLIPGGTELQPTVCVYDRQLRLRLELSPDLSRGYGTRGGVEFPAAGLRLLRAWGSAGVYDVQPLELPSQDLILSPLR